MTRTPRAEPSSAAREEPDPAADGPHRDQPQRSSSSQGGQETTAGRQGQSCALWHFLSGHEGLDVRLWPTCWPHTVSSEGACPCWPCLFTHRLEGCEYFRGHFHVEPTHILTGEVRVETEPSESPPPGFCVLGRAQLQGAAREGLHPARLPPPAADHAGQKVAQVGHSSLPPGALRNFSLETGSQSNCWDGERRSKGWGLPSNPMLLWAPSSASG